MTSTKFTYGSYYIWSVYVTYCFKG